MYLVAITRWAAPLDAEIGYLARITGVTPPDLRMRVAGQLPVYLADGLDAPTAERLLHAVSERGHGCVASDTERIPAASSMFVPRNFSFTDSALIGTSRVEETLEMPFAEVLGLVRATAVMDETTTVETKKRKLSLGRMAMTGGLVPSKTVTKRQSSTRVEREQVLYIFRRTARDHMVLRESELQYSGLGVGVGHSRHENFNILIDLVRKGAPECFFDTRFVSQRPSRLPHGAIVGGSVEATELDLAVFVLIVAHLKNQL